MNQLEVLKARAALRRDIARVVAEAKEAGTELRPAYHAGILAAEHAGAETTVGAIIEDIVAEAERLSVPSQPAQNRKSGR